MDFEKSIRWGVISAVMVGGFMLGNWFAADQNSERQKNIESVLPPIPIDVPEATSQATPDQIKIFHKNVQKLAKQAFLTGQCQSFIDGADIGADESLSVFDQDIDTVVTLNAEAQSILAQFYRGEITSLDDLTYALTVNGQQIPRNQARYIMAKVKDAIES